MKKYWKFTAISIIVVLISSLSSLIAPFMIQYWSNSSTGLNLKRVFLVTLLLFFTAIFELTGIYIRENFAKDFNKSNCMDMLSILLNMSYDKINENGCLNITARIRQAVNDFYLFYINGRINILVSKLVLFGIVTLTLMDNIYVALLLVSIIIVNVFGYRSLNQELLNKSALLQKDTASGWQAINSKVSQVDYIKQLPAYTNLMNQIEPSVDKIYKSMRNINVYAQTISRSIMLLNNWVQTLIVLFVAWGFVESTNNIYSLIYYSIGLPLFFSNLNQLVTGNIDKRNVTVSREYITGLKNEREQDGTIEICGIDSIHFNFKEAPESLVNFQYLEQKYKKGDIIWIKGNSGSGKSTLMKYLVKFRITNYISVNDIVLASIKNDSLREHIEYIPQKPAIIQGTLRDNLFLGKEYSVHREKSLLQHKILQSILQTKTLDTIIEEDGSNLSGGEKQKIAFARAIINPADVWIFDEITSNIDSTCAEEIYSTIKAMHEDKIVFIISHDDIVSKYCNKVLVI